MSCCNKATAKPFDNLSVNDIAPKTNAPLSVLDPIKSVVKLNDVQSITVLPHPRNIDAIIDVVFVSEIRPLFHNKKQLAIIRTDPIE